MTETKPATFRRSKIVNLVKRMETKRQIVLSQDHDEQRAQIMLDLIAEIMAEFEIDRDEVGLS